MISLVFSLFIIGNYVSLYNTATSYTESKLFELYKLLEKDFHLVKGKLSSIDYYRDTTLPYDNSVYIITNDGFVIERSKQFDGLLDVADGAYALSFETPQTITSPGNIKWRMLSKKIIRNNNQEGVILVAYSDPSVISIKEIDDSLYEDLDKLDKMVGYDKGSLDFSKIDSTKIRYSTYYQIIDKFNHVQVDEGAPPSYIDKSYLAEYYGKKLTFTKKNSLTGETFLFSSFPLLKNEGIILVGRSIQDFQIVIARQQWFLVGTSIIFLVCLFLMLIVSKKELINIVSKQTEENINKISKPNYIDPKKISFNYEDGAVEINEKSIRIEYGTKQHDFCKILFQNPSKRWEQDEIGDKLHLQEEDIHERTFYDIRKSINKKIYSIIGMDFISYEQKRFFVNPKLASFIVKTSSKK